MEWSDSQELLAPIGVSRESRYCCLLFTTALPPSGWSLVLVWCWMCQSTSCIWSKRESDTLTAAVFSVLYLSGLDTFPCFLIVFYNLVAFFFFLKKHCRFFFFLRGRHKLCHWRVMSLRGLEWFGRRSAKDYDWELRMTLLCSCIENVKVWCVCTHEWVLTQQPAYLIGPKDAVSNCQNYCMLLLSLHYYCFT